MKDLTPGVLDEVADLLNNEIGRSVGDSMERGSSTRSLVDAVIEEFRNEGLWTVSEANDGKFALQRERLDKSSYTKLKGAIKNKDDYGEWFENREGE